jgi:dienelactone hydrolase
MWLLFSLFAMAAGGLTEKAVEYKSGSQTFQGFLVYKNGTHSAPGVLVVHDWLGLTDKTKEKARALAKLGYVAFAADVYGKGIRPSQEEAGKIAGEFKADRAKLRANTKAALDTMMAQPMVNKKKVAAIGYCFGGTTAIELARSGAPLLGVVSFHGGLDSPTPDDGQRIQGKILALHGADDPNVKPEDLAAFENEMRSAKVDWRLVKFGNAVHSFTDRTAGNDNSKGAAYNEKADIRSWEEMKDFFKEIF